MELNEEIVQRNKAVDECRMTRTGWSARARHEYATADGRNHVTR